jgi:hypothetical protein
MGIGGILESILFIVGALALVIIVLGVLKNVTRHGKGRYRYSRKGKSSDFEG